MHYFIILHGIYTYNVYKSHICTHDTQRHALITPIGFGEKVRKHHQKSPSEYQFSMTGLIVFVLATGFYFSVVKAMNLIALMPQ